MIRQIWMAIARLTRSRGSAPAPGATFVEPVSSRGSGTPRECKRKKRAHLGRSGAWPVHLAGD